MSEFQRPPAEHVPDFRVGEWLAEPALNCVSSGERVQRMRPQLMDVLVCLARHHGRVVLKEELLAEVWPDRNITESGLVRCIAELRQLLGDDPRKPAYIETISKRGYRLIAAVEWRDDAQQATAPDGSVAARPAVPAAAESGGEVGAPAIDATPAPPESSWFRRRWLALPAVLVLSAVALLLSFLGRGAPAKTLTEQDWVVLAFENSTNDRVFDETLPMALAIQLEQSPFLRLLPNDRVRQTLELMQRPADSPITRSLGLELCERAGAAALIVSSVTPLGQHYVIGLEAVACANRAVIGRQQVEVDRQDRVLSALGTAASQLRRDLGESRVSIAEYDVPITEATTPSLEALRVLRQGDAARNRGQSAEALRFYREAASLDPEFALAQLRFGAFALAQHYEQEGVAALEKAYALRERVTFPERLEIDLIYHSNLTGDQNKVTEALETMRRVYPRRLSGRRRLAAHYGNIGRFDEALPEALEGLALEPTSSAAYLAVARAQLALNRLDEVRTTVETALARGIGSESLHATLLLVAFLRGDAELLARERAWAQVNPEATPEFLEIEAEDAVWRGRLRDSLAHLDAYQAWSLQRGAEYRWIVLELRKARFEALCGFSDRARRRMGAQLATGKLGADLQVDALKVAVSAGDVARVEQLIAGLDRIGWPKGQEPFAGFVVSYRAALETGRGRPARALELLAPMVPYELGFNWGLIPLHERARAHLAAGDWQQARDAYQKMLDHPGVYSGQKLLPLAQLGVARSLAAGGLAAESRAAYEQFLTLWKDADADLPLLADARRELARLR